MTSRSQGLFPPHPFFKGKPWGRGWSNCSVLFNFSSASYYLASHAGDFRGARFSSLPTNACSTEDNIPFPCLANHMVLSKFWKVDLDRKVI